MNDLLPHESIELSALQMWMQAVLIQPLGEVGPAPWENLPENFHQNPVEQLIHSSEKLTAQQHLRIYQSSYILRLRDCMAKQFSALEFALGKELFQHFADQYLQIHPSTSHTLSDLGAKFPHFLQTSRPDADAEVKEDWPDFLIELADFEYAVNVLFDVEAEPDDKDVVEAKAETPDEMLRIRPVFQTFRHSHPIAAYYRAFFNDLNPELPFPQTTFSVLLRKNYRLGIFDVMEAQYFFLHYLQESGSVSIAIEKLATNHGRSISEVNKAWQIWRQDWIEKGFFILPIPHNP